MIVYVYDGSKPYLETKGVFNAEDGYRLSRSSTQARYSDLMILGENVENTIKHLDILRLEIEGWHIAWGFAISPVFKKLEPNSVEVSFGFGTDGILSDVYIDRSFTKPNIIQYLKDEITPTKCPVSIDFLPSTTIYLWLISLTASKELSILLLKLL